MRIALTTAAGCLKNFNETNKKHYKPMHVLSFSSSRSMVGIVSASTAILVLSGHWLPSARGTGLELSIQRGAKPILQWPSQTDGVYQIEYATALSPANWQILTNNLPGNGSALSLTDNSASGAQRFYRLVATAKQSSGTNQAAISPDVTIPTPGLLYPGSTLLGAAPLGFQYRIPAAWKGGFRQGTATMIFGSDTEPGLVLGILTLAGDPSWIAQLLSSSFQTSASGGYSVSQTVTANGNRITGEWIGYGTESGAIMRLDGVVHPSGGLIGFAGFFTPNNRGIMEQTLASFIASIVTVPRSTDQNWINALRGRAFQWVSFNSAGNGGSSGSLSRWSQNNAFFCDGTYEITTASESSYSGSLSGGGFYTGGSSSNSTEAGDWTVIQTTSGPVLILLSAQGVQAAVVALGPSGNTFYFGDQEYSLTGAANCASP